MPSSCSSVETSSRWASTTSCWRSRTAGTPPCISRSCWRAVASGPGWCRRDLRPPGDRDAIRHPDRVLPMIKSMTGFAALTREDERATVSVTIRAVNHRHLDLQLRSPQSLASIEADLRALVSRHVARGRVELGVSVQLRQVAGVEVELNDDFAHALEIALDQA